MKKVFSVLFIGLVTIACREELTPLKAPIDPPLVSTCKALSIEKNIIGTWRFESNRSPIGTTRSGLVTFTAQNHIIDPDSLFENYIDTGSKIFKIVDKIYTTDGTYLSGFAGYTGKIFRVDLLIRNNEMGTVWPLYVTSNECNKIVIYQLGSYNRPVSERYGFTLTR